MRFDRMLPSIQFEIDTKLQDQLHFLINLVIREHSRLFRAARRVDAPDAPGVICAGRRLLRRQGGKQARDSRICQFKLNLKFIFFPILSFLFVPTEDVPSHFSDTDRARGRGGCR